MQFLSEPSSGSDVAGALTSAVREGDDWVLNGSKIWTTGAWWSDWALCLARTNWDVPKHRGLTVFILPITAAGVDVQRIEMLNGNKEFCQEFLTDVAVPDSDRIGEVDGGWTVGTRWMFHERMLHNSPYVTDPGRLESYGGVDATFLVEVARDAGRLDDPRGARAARRGPDARPGPRGAAAPDRPRLVAGKMPDQSAAIAGSSAVSSPAGSAPSPSTSPGRPARRGRPRTAWSPRCGNDFLLRQTMSIGGGTTEMARNVISERVLGMPRESALDRDRNFRDVPRGASNRS